MGTTLPPFSHLIEGEPRQWMPFKKALSKADQGMFDRLFDGAKLPIQARVVMSGRAEITGEKKGLVTQSAESAPSPPRSPDSPWPSRRKRRMMQHVPSSGNRAWRATMVASVSVVEAERDVATLAGDA